MAVVRRFGQRGVLQAMRTLSAEISELLPYLRRKRNITPTVAFREKRKWSSSRLELMLQLCRLDGMADHPDRWSFSEIARRTASVLGSSTVFALACVTVVVWAVTGPIFGYSDSWRLVINTGTTIVTFPMVF